MSEKDVKPQEQAETADKKPITDPLEQLKKFSRGTVKLMFPFRAHSQDVEKLDYDFCKLTGYDMAEALDTAPVNNIFAITNMQALALFAAAAERCAPYIEENGHSIRLYDAKDIMKNLQSVDFVEPMKISKAFYNASSRVGSGNTSNG